MAVIINEFEVIVEEEEVNTTNDTEVSTSRGGQAGFSPYDIEDIVKHESYRTLRVYAD